MKAGTRLCVAATLILLLAGGFLYFPGHTFLQSDTQIYLPILDRLSDPTLFRHDPVALRPHVTYTIYDEMARGLRALTGLGFQQVLTLQQLAFRLCGLAGVFLLGRACGLLPQWAILFASIYGLGATIVGPSVLIAEYEPVPRGYAVPLLLFAVGLAASRNWAAAGLAAGVAVLYHPPTTLPIFVAGAASLWLTREPSSGDGGWRKAFAAIVGATLLLFVISRFQAGETESQRFFATIDPDLEKLQRLRGSYNFISVWFRRWASHWAFVFALAGFAWWRVRALNLAPRFVSTMALALLGYVLLVLPLSYLLLEQLKWSMMTQFQPLRSLLWVTLMAMLGAVLNGIQAAQNGKLAAASAWLASAYLLTGQLDPLSLPMQAFSDPAMRLRLVVFAGLGLLAAATVRYASLPALGLALALPFFAIPQLGKVRNYGVIDHPEVHALAEWAQQNTSKDAVFQFPDAGQALYPGLFRVYAQRGLYVDWKGGGQVNLLKDFADDWWVRWQAAGEKKVDPSAFAQDRVPALAKLGIDYVVLQAANRLPGREPEYSNAKYSVYRIR